LGGLALYRLRGEQATPAVTSLRPVDDAAWSGLSAADATAARTALEAAVASEEAAARRTLQAERDSAAPAATGTPSH
jgi:hypothetical protein